MAGLQARDGKAAAQELEKQQLAEMCVSALFKAAVMLLGSSAVLRAVLQWGSKLKGIGISQMSVR